MNDFTLTDENIPRFIPTADFLCAFRFFFYNNSKIVDYIKLKIFGTLTNLNTNRFKGGINPIKFG